MANYTPSEKFNTDYRFLLGTFALFQLIQRILES